MEAYANVFLDFEKFPNRPVPGLANKLLATLTTTGIPVSCMVNQGYDGAAALSGCKNGVHKHIYDKHPQQYQKAGEVTGIKKSVTLMNKIAGFYHSSSLRTRNF